MFKWLTHKVSTYSTISVVYSSHLLSWAHTYVDTHYFISSSVYTFGRFCVLNLSDQGWLLLSYAFNDPEAFQCDTSVRRTKIFFFCSRGDGSVRDIPFLIQYFPSLLPRWSCPLLPGYSTVCCTESTPGWMLLPVQLAYRHPMWTSQ